MEEKEKKKQDQCKHEWEKAGVQEHYRYILLFCKHCAKTLTEKF